MCLKRFLFLILGAAATIRVVVEVLSLFVIPPVSLPSLIFLILHTPHFRFPHYFARSHVYLSQINQFLTLTAPDTQTSHAVFIEQAFSEQMTESPSRAPKRLKMSEQEAPPKKHVIAADGDVHLIVGTGEDCVDLLVSSKNLSLRSPVFAGMLKLHFREGRELSSLGSV